MSQAVVDPDISPLYLTCRCPVQVQVKRNRALRYPEVLKLKLLSSGSAESNRDIKTTRGALTFFKT
ncbi:hypothetical protein E2C01_011507 [Portunus trituberculatus]|uniref:Uncharacterized protein n=1 Tax=Portunus trituberculatus TaxID=210409 RepID=A0A5B7DBL3_PORTR|nr:hypothetical protein [Portunus trituberculatus]